MTVCAYCKFCVDRQEMSFCCIEDAENIVTLLSDELEHEMPHYMLRYTMSQDDLDMFIFQFIRLVLFDDTIEVSIIKRLYLMLINYDVDMLSVNIIPCVVAMVMESGDIKGNMLRSKSVISLLIKIGADVNRIVLCPYTVHYDEGTLVSYASQLEEMKDRIRLESYSSVIARITEDYYLRGWTSLDNFLRQELRRRCELKNFLLDVSFIFRYTDKREMFKQ